KLAQKNVILCVLTTISTSFVFFSGITSNTNTYTFVIFNFFLWFDLVFNGFIILFLFKTGKNDKYYNLFCMNCIKLINIIRKIRAIEFQLSISQTVSSTSNSTNFKHTQSQSIF